MNVIDKVSNINTQQWDTLIKISATRNVFQTKDYYNFISSLPFFSPFIYAIENDNSNLRGIVVGYIQKEKGMMKSVFSRRAIINGGILIANNATDEELYTLLRALVKGLKNKAIYIEFRNLLDYSKYRHIFEKCGFRYEPHLNFHVNTTTAEIVQKNIYKTKRRKINSTIKEGAIIDSSPSIEDIHKFYTLLKNLYRNKVKKPLLPYMFFERLYNQPFSKYLIVKKDNEVLGGQVVLCLPNDTVYLLFLCGEDGKYSGIFPSILGTYSGIQYAVETGCIKCDMMGAGKPDVDYGVRNFKAEFGGELVEHGRFICVLNRPLYSIGKLGLKILQKM